MTRFVLMFRDTRHPTILREYKSKDDAEIDPVAFDFEVCNIADPDLVRMVCSKLAFQQIRIVVFT